MKRLMKIKLQAVRYMPKALEPGILYVSKEFGAAAHLCACGCGAKIRTPLGPTDWNLKETRKGPTLSPSIGNWQQRCQSHYWIRNGQVVWVPNWNEAGVAANQSAQPSESRRGKLLGEVWSRVRKIFSG